MLNRFLRSSLAPWSGLIAAPIAWVVNHQGIGDAVYFDCKAGNPATSIIIGGVTCLAAVVAGGLSWRARRSVPPTGAQDAPDEQSQSRSFISLLSVLLCALLIVAIVLQTAAGLILPGCYR